MAKSDNSIYDFPRIFLIYEPIQLKPYYHQKNDKACSFIFSAYTLKYALHKKPAPIRKQAKYPDFYLSAEGKTHEVRTTRSLECEIQRLFTAAD